MSDFPSNPLAPIIHHDQGTLISMAESALGILHRRLERKGTIIVDALRTLSAEITRSKPEDFTPSNLNDLRTSFTLLLNAVETVPTFVASNWPGILSEVEADIQEDDDLEESESESESDIDGDQGSSPRGSDGPETCSPL